MAQQLPINLEIERMCSYLASLSFTVTRDWLTGCVEYFRNEHSSYNASELQEFVRKQWELSDLRDSSGGSLPPNLQNQMKITLRGRYAVQIESVLNISESAYGQMQKIRKVDVVNLEATEKKQESWEPRPGRMLKMKLCDGQQQAEAVEYRPLHTISEHILPGTKILIIGPVDCRRGIFFLKPENVKMIGGEVDSLLIVNHMENILARALSLPENQDPFSAPSDAVATQPPATAVSDSQRSTYTPSIAATPGPSGRQLNIQVAGRSMFQQSIVDAFRNRPTQETPADDLNASLDGTGWTVDDLLAEEDDAFLQLAEERSVVAAGSSTASTTTRCTNDIPYGNRPVQNRQHVSASIGGDSVFKVPQVPIISSKQSSTQKCGSKPSNPFLADDVDIDAVDLEWEDEMNEFINVPSKSSPSTFSTSKSTTLVRSFNQNEPSTSKGTIATSSFKWPQMPQKPQSNIQSKQFCTGRSVQELQQKNNLSSTTSSILRQNISHEMKEASVEQALSSNIHSPTSSSSRSSEAGVRFSSENSKPNQEKNEVCKNVDFSRSASPDQKQMPQSFNQQPPKSIPFSPPSGVFENDEDWANAYLSSQNSNFVNKLDKCEKLSTSPAQKLLKSPTNLMDISPRGAVGVLKRPSSSWGNVKSTEALSCAGPSGSKVSPQGSPSAGDRSFFESRSHLRPAVSSPSCMREESEVVPKALELSSSSNCVPSIKPVASSSSKSLSLDVELPSNKKRALVTPLKSSSLMSLEPFVYLVHVLQSPMKTSGTHRIKATIMTLLSQLKVEPGLGWSLSVKLCDGTATLDVQFSPLVLDEIIGMSAQEFKKLKRDIPNNPLLKEKLVKKLENTREILINLNCFFDIKFQDGKMAQVVKLSEITEQDVNKLKLRLNDS